MPYKNLNELPEEVRESLPLEGQRTYAAAYNMAWERHRNLDHYAGKKSRDELARDFAWSEIERLYARDGQSKQWRKKEGMMSAGSR